MLSGTSSDYCNTPLNVRRCHQKQQQLLCAFVLSRLDYWNSLLAGCSKYLLSKLRKVQNSAVTHIFATTKSAHVTPMLHSLHWLPTEQRIEYKLFLLCFKIMFSPGSHLPFRTSSPLHLRSSADTRVFRIPSFRTKNEL